MDQLKALVATGILVTACASEDNQSVHHSTAREADMAHAEDLGQIIATHSDRIMGLEDVVGMGESLCDGTPCVRVFLARENAASLARIQEDLAGIPFAIEISGNFTARPK
jgi:hypothetical protein